MSTTPAFRAEQLALSQVTLFVGLDYPKDPIPVCVLDHAGTILLGRASPDHAAAVVAAVIRHGQGVQATAVMRSGSAALADELDTRRGWLVDRAHPGSVARMRQTPDQTDGADARMLADPGRVGSRPKV